MGLALTLKADSVNMQALGTGRTVVDVNGINLSELINRISENGYLLRVVDKPDQHTTSIPPPLTTLTCIRCSTAHTTETDSTWPYSLSHQTNDNDESGWIYFISGGHLLRTGAWSYPVPRLKRLGLSKTFRYLIVTFTRRYGTGLIHLDASVECPSGLSTFNW